MEPLLIAGHWQSSQEWVASFRAENPATGETIGPEFPVSGAADVELALASASAVAPELAAAEPERIGAFLDAYAERLEAAADELCAIADGETALGVKPRLREVELPRTLNQLRQAAQVARSRAWTEPVIDTRAGLRTCFAPLSKPVAIFGPNNFPLAFNAVSGGDFAAAIAARTGSRAGVLALKQAAVQAGVPFYAEMSSINPVFMLPGALAERGDEIAKEFVASCLAGCGQFCTNPGVVVVPRGASGAAFVAAARRAFEPAPAGVLLAGAVLDPLQKSVSGLRRAGAEVLCGGSRGDGPGYRFRPTLLG